MSFMGDADLVGTRWRAAPDAAFGAYIDGALVGSNFAADWESFGFFGPLTVRPDLWDRGSPGGCSRRPWGSSSGGARAKRGCSPSPTAPSTSGSTADSASNRRR